MGRIAAFCRGVPVVSTYHNADLGVGRIRLYDLVDRATAWLAEPIAVSDEIRRGLPCAAALIKNFVELAEVPSSCNSVPPRTVAFVGRLSHEKGPDEFCALAQDMPDLRFEIFGNGPSRSNCSAPWRGCIPRRVESWRTTGAALALVHAFSLRGAADGGA